MKKLIGSLLFSALFLLSSLIIFLINFLIDRKFIMRKDNF